MPRNFALTIGINEYQNEESLRFAGNDARAMQAYFRELEFEEVILYTDDETQYRPEYTNLVMAIDHISQRVRLNTEDSFWFFFSGHGVRQAGRDYLLPSNAYAGNLQLTAISVESVVRSLKKCGAGNLVMILDACRNVIPNLERSYNQTAELVRQAGIITLFSCGPGQKSYELPELKQGAFTHELLQALQGKYHPSRCNVTDLNRHLQATVPQLVSQRLQTEQCPYVIAEPLEKASQILLPDLLPTAKEVESTPAADVTNEATNLTDISLLMFDAMQATQSQDWEQAKTLWSQILFQADNVEHRKGALEQRDYVICQQLKQFPQPVNFEKVLLRSPQNLESPQPKKAMNYPQSFVEELGEGVTLQMLLIPAGGFLLGSSNRDVEFWQQTSNNYFYDFGSEQPQHYVEITEPFYLGKFQVTCAQWRAVIGLDPLNHQHGADYPVEQVSWDDCQAFIERLNEQTGKQYRLPSEVEWEYACRAGSTTYYCFGNDEAQLDHYAWFKENSYNKLYPVGKKKPNAWGLHDIHGNVWEWCDDFWTSDYNEFRSQTAITNNGGDRRVVRGGSGNSSLRNCRSAFRSRHDQDGRFDMVGFRVACVAPDFT